jgi:hypothetical protein
MDRTRRAQRTPVQLLAGDAKQETLPESNRHIGFFGIFTTFRTVVHSAHVSYVTSGDRGEKPEISLLVR